MIAQVVQEEAKGTSVEARAAVANTIYNRYLSSKYPNTIEGIIFQKNQYTVADDEDEIRSVKPVEKRSRPSRRFLLKEIPSFRRTCSFPFGKPRHKLGG